MPRENSFSDEERSLTPDLDEPDVPVAAASPTSPRGAPSSKTGKAETVRTARSVRSRAQAPVSTLRGADRFRASVRKVIQMHRTSTIITRRGAGAEPGIDPRRNSAYLQYGGIRQNCVIDIVDYSSVRSSVQRLTNTEFVDLMHDPAASLKESWVKVRWINVGGISWDVVSAMALKYDLHPLSLEDVLHQPRGGLLSKIDYYRQHMFMRVLCHSLGTDKKHEHDILSFGDPATNDSYVNMRPEDIEGLPRTSSPHHIDDDLGEPTDDEQTAYNTSKRPSLFKTLPRPKTEPATRPSRYNAEPDIENGAFEKSRPKPMKQLGSRYSMDGVYHSEASENRVRNAHAIEELKRGERVDVKISPMCIFLLRDGTVISIHPAPNLDFSAPIAARLKHRDTGLRSSADPSLLVHALLDLIVDRALEVVDEYQAKILELEHRVLLRPHVKVVRDLHLISGDLILHRRTLEPIKTLVYGLRRYDDDRMAALLSDEEREAKVPCKGYMSHKAKIYLADVVDHMDYILTSVDMFSGIAENLINFTFNMASNQMNETMRRLTLATIIFLPLTLLTGYFGMNFTRQWSTDNHSDLLFWEIALPLMAVIIPLFCMSDIKGAIHYMQKRMAVARATPSAYKGKAKRA